MRVSKRNIALLLIVIIFISGFGVGYFFVFGVATEFQWTRAIDGNPRPSYSIEITNLANCTVDISFIDDSLFLYSVSIELDKPGRVDTTPETSLLGIEEDFVFYEYDREDYYSLHISQNYNAAAKIKAVNLTLGNGVSFNLGIGGLDNVTVDALYNNGAPLDSIDFRCGRDMSLNLAITEDVVYSGYGVDLSIDVTMVNLDVDLPYGMSGRLVFICPGEFHVTPYGWYTTLLSGDSRYYESDDDPLTPMILTGSVRADEIIAVLRD